MSALWGNVGAGRSFLSPLYDRAYRKAGHTHTQTPADTVAVYDSRLIRAVRCRVGGVVHLAAGRQPRHFCRGDNHSCFHPCGGKCRFCIHCRKDNHARSATLVYVVVGKVHRHYNGRHVVDLHQCCCIAVHVVFNYSVYDDYHCPLDNIFYRDGSKYDYDIHHQAIHDNYHADRGAGQEIPCRVGYGVSLHHGGWPTPRGGYVDLQSGRRKTAYVSQKLGIYGCY